MKRVMLLVRAALVLSAATAEARVTRIEIDLQEACAGRQTVGTPSTTWNGLSPALSA